MSIHNKPTLRGDHLSPEDQAHVLRAYIYRNTHENARRELANSKLPPITDRRWLEITEFAVTKGGRLDLRVHECYTHHNEVPGWKLVIDAWMRQQYGPTYAERYKMGIAP